MNVSILDFGAVGDGKTLCTESINKAIEHCSKTGGRVTVPAGTYLTGTVWLGSGVELHLEQGAVILGSPDFADYCADDAYPQNFGVADEEWTGGHLLVAVGCHDVAITGLGTIDGNSESFFGKASVKHEPWTAYGWREGFRRTKRPGQMINFVECERVRVENVTLQNSPSWCLFLYGSETVNIHGVRIFNLPYNANTDGIDIDSCRYVTVSDCIIDTGDDAIAVRNGAKRLTDKERVCEYINVSNCVLSACACMVRVGVGSGLIRRMRFSNITSKRSGVLISFCTEYGGKPLTPLDDINFDGISADDAGAVVRMNGDYGVSAKHLTVQNVRAHSRRGISITNAVPGAFADVTLRNIDIFLIDKPSEITDEIRKMRGDTIIEAWNVSDLTLDGVRLFADDELRAKWKNISSFTNCPNLEVRNCKFE